MEFTGERAIEGKTPERIWLDHVSRYKFSSNYVKNKIVLDISCGTGYGSRILADAGAIKVIGIDISIEAIEIARSLYQIDKLQFKGGDILNIYFPEGYFDVVTCFETIEHIDHQEIALEQLRRVLKTNGLLIISTPNRKVTTPFKTSKDLTGNPFHKIEYTFSEFSELLKNYFEILEIYGQRPIHKLFFLPFIERITWRLLPIIYNPERGSPQLEKLSSKKEYRYITLVCKKSDNSTL